ncbi:hypothetical protein BKA70DRAFT_1272424 [Coprinopsis sp. MPI-PUGE-AT-0042]|nr:hypothetical protein BKA70DRAFT_1272424 [Coprinopsis sp. MPI-PUGE-AT-0042]
MDSHPQLPPNLSLSMPLQRRPKLEGASDAKRPSRDHRMKPGEEHSELQHPLRRIPPEIWGIIFSFTLGDAPFGWWEYRTHRYLRKVCTTWKDVMASTPDICRGLEVHLDGPLAQAAFSVTKGVRYVGARLEPWLAIVSRNYPYHLSLTAKRNANLTNWPVDHAREFMQWILTTSPTPTILTIDNFEVFSFPCACAPRENQISHLSVDFLVNMGHEDFLIAGRSFETILPSLKTLVSNASVELDNPIGHPNVEALIFSRVCGPAKDFGNFLLEFSSLREIRFESEEQYHRPGNTPFSSTPIIHPTVEVLVAQGEDLILLLEHITCPSLKYFSLCGWGETSGDYKVMAEILPAFLQRCSRDNKDFTAAIRGEPHKFIFDLFMHSIPRGTRLHVDLDKLKLDETDTDGEVLPTSTFPKPPHTFTEIFCTKRLNDFNWLFSDNGPPDSEPIKVYMPKGIMVEDQVIMHQEGLRDSGYALEILQLDTYKRLLRSSLPTMTVEWDPWE